MAKKIFAFIMAAVLAFTAFAGCTAQKDADTAKENITTTKKVTDDSNFKLSYTQADSLDPFKSKTQNNQVLSSLVFESLFDIDENWESVPNISTMNFYSCTVSGFEQYAMAAFIEKGYFERHIKRLVNDYRGRREKICRMFRESRLNEISTIYQDDGVNPFIDVCKEEKKGLFILVKTSNPSSGEFQDRLIDGRPLYELVGEKVAEWGAECMGDEYSYIGAVVGATYPEMGKVLRKIMPKSYILVPGYGAQGGKGKDLVHFFNEDGLGAIVNSSRGIIAAYKQEAYAKFGAENFGDASRAAVEAMIADISGALAAK